MKDLYLRLGINESASTQEIAAALELTPERDEYALILLREQRRSVYDRAHATLRSIGMLRQSLGLISGDSWFEKRYQDFVPGRRSGVIRSRAGMAQPAEKKLQDSDEVRAQEDAKSKPATRSKWLIPVLLGITAIVLLVLIFKLI